MFFITKKREREINVKNQQKKTSFCLKRCDVMHWFVEKRKKKPKKKFGSEEQRTKKSMNVCLGKK
jgi:hypothetical protein